MKHRGSAILLMTILSIAALFSVSAMAADETRYTRDLIDFVPGTGPVPPLDPDDPAVDLTESENIVFTGNTGALTLNALPDFLFAGADGSAFPARLTGDAAYPLYRPLRPYVQISDLRGTGEGWTLSVSASRFYRDGEPALNGAVLRLSGGTALSANPALTPPEVSEALTIECLGQDIAPAVVARAGANAGMGAWVIRWYPLDEQGRFEPDSPAHMAGVDLYVPAEEAILPGAYTATLYWTLTNAPPAPA